MAEASPHDVGKILGTWIINSCKMERFTGDQIALIEKSKTKLDIYYIEVLCLSVFAASSVIIFCADNNEQARIISNEMISEVRRLAAGETVISAVFDHILVGRSEKYGKVMPDEMRRDHANTTSPIALKFLNIIKSPDDNKERLKDGAAPYYGEDGKLVRPPAFKKLEEEIGAATMLTDISMNYFYKTLKETEKILEQSGIIKQT